MQRAQFGEAAQRVVRGSCWRAASQHCKAALRQQNKPCAPLSEPKKPWLMRCHVSVASPPAGVWAPGAGHADNARKGHGSVSTESSAAPLAGASAALRSMGAIGVYEVWVVHAPSPAAGSSAAGAVAVHALRW